MPIVPFDARLAVELSADSELCPHCGMEYLIPGTKAAKVYGVCPTCLLKARVEAERAENRALVVNREYARLRKENQRERASQDVSPSDKHKKPDFR